MPTEAKPPESVDAFITSVFSACREGAISHERSALILRGALASSLTRHADYRALANDIKRYGRPKAVVIALK